MRFFEQRAYGLREIRLVVTSTTPGGIVQVTPETDIELRSEYEEPDDEPHEGGGYVTYDDIGGLDDAIDQVREMVDLPLKSPELFERLGLDPPKGVLLHGPPGTGRTLLTRAVANESEVEFYSIAGPEIMGKYYGESEERLREVFDEAEENSPSIIFFDEIDLLAPKRGGSVGEPAVTERVVNTLLADMDGLEELEGVVVIGATNRPSRLDPALLRSGRFDEIVRVTLPDEEGRRKILEIHTEDMPLADDVDLDHIAAETDGYTGADLENLARQASVKALREDIDIERIPMRIFEETLGETRASVTPEMEKEYDEVARRLKQEGPESGNQIGFTSADERE